MPGSRKKAGGQGARPKRWELRQDAQALRNDWPVPAERKLDMLETAEGLLKARSKRLAVAGMNVLIQLARLTLGQQKLDFDRERLTGAQKQTTNLADLVAEAEQRAEQRKRERNGTRQPVPSEGAPPPDAGPAPGEVVPDDRKATGKRRARRDQQPAKGPAKKRRGK
jgi:hypothetical protein